MPAHRKTHYVGTAQDCALLVARRWLAARHRRSPLPAQRLLVAYNRDRQTSALLGTVDTLLSRRSRLLRLPLGASMTVSRRPQERVWPGPFPQTLEFGLRLGGHESTVIRIEFSGAACQCLCGLPYRTSQ